MQRTETSSALDACRSKQEVTKEVLMKKSYRIGFIACCATLLFFAGESMAAKPLDVIQLSNGYPSGEHFNLNIHGKHTNTCDSTEPGGRSVFVPEYGEATIEYVSNKKSSITELTVLDPCGGFNGPNDSAKVQLPSESQGYYVFAALKGKPQNGSEPGSGSSVRLWPNPVLEVCNDTAEPNPDFPTYTSCPDTGTEGETVMALGLVTNTGAYEMTDAGLVRFDNSTDTNGKGRSKATDITGLFMWSGFVCDATLDSDGDGVLDVDDLASADINGDGVVDSNDIPDINGDGSVDETDLKLFMETNLSCTYYENEWVFNVADLVVQDQTIQNDGTKLLKIRFYPVATTSFVR
jgi:hypothetical protein